MPASSSPGDRVLVKPFFTHMGSSNPERRWVSHPIFVRCVVEAVRDCGARVELGDVRLAPRDASVAPDKRWIYELAHETGAQPVSFARAGLVKVRSGVLYLRHFYVSRAVLEADLVVNCANAVAQDGLLLRAR